MDAVLDYNRCSECGHVEPAPVDGRWRWAVNGTVYATLAEAQLYAARLSTKGTTSKTHEYLAAVDSLGAIRICSRRRRDA